MAQQDRPPSFTDPTEDGVQSYLFGGLNTTATPLNTPLEDSPLLLNMDTGIAGSVEKRKGSRVLFRGIGENPKGVVVVPFTSTLNYNLTIVKQSTELHLYEVINDVATRVIRKQNVFSSAASNVKPSWVRTAEYNPRVLFFTQVNKPIQLTFIEKQQTFTSGAVSSVVVSGMSDLANANVDSTICYINRVRQPSATYSYNSTTKALTVNGISATGTYTVDLIHVTWQWWAEAMLWEGQNYYRTVTRFNANPIDQNVAIPESLRTDTDAPYNVDVPLELTTYKKSFLGAGSGYLNAGRQPDTDVKWGYGDGSRYIYSADNYLNPTPFFITFGALEAGTPTTTVYMVRRRELRLNNNEGILPANLDVYLNGNLRPWLISNTTPYYERYWLFYRSYDSTNDYYFSNSIVTNPPVSSSLATDTHDNTAYYLSWESAYLGVPLDAKIETINKEVKHVGSGAVATRYANNDGTYYPVYGIGLYADYKNGYYPGSAEFYQGRLVLSNFPNSPLTVLFSNTYDSATPGQFYNFFQVTDNLEGIATDPFDITINSRPDDRVIATVEFQSSLFVLTRRATFRITGGNSPLSITSNAVVFVSNIGCVNQQSYTKTDKDILYLSDTGVYNLLPQVENQEYQASELSIKIRDVFGVTADPTYENLPWIQFDDVSKKVYMGYPVKYEPYTNWRLFVLNTVRNSWTEYTTPSRFQSFDGAPYTDRQLGAGFLLAVTDYRNSDTTPADIVLLKLNDAVYMDFIRKVTAVGGSENFIFTRTPQFVYTTSNLQQMYSIDPNTANIANSVQYGAFDTLPLQEVEDVVVTLDGVRLVALDDYIKTPGGYIYLRDNPGAGKALVIKPRRPVADSEAGLVLYNVTESFDVPFYNVMIDNNMTLQTVNISTQVSGGVTRNYVTMTLTAGQVIEYGVPYLSVYSTPIFTHKTLRHLKVRKWVYAYFDNTLGKLLFTAADLNNAVGQNPTEVVDVPKTRVNANISLLFSSENSGETTADLYGFDAIVWDDSLFDINAPATAFQNFQLFKEPLRGTGYSYQMLVWNYDHATFKLVGYQIDGTTKGKRNKGNY